MYCINCGTQLPDEANFCLNCGKPQKAETRPDEIKLETCEIVWEWVSRGTFGMGATKMTFRAKAIGPNGTYFAGTSEVFSGQQDGPNSGEQNQVAALDNFINKLTQDGWQQSTRGLDWFSYRFQRQTKIRTGSNINGNLVIVQAGPKKIEVIKVIRQLTNMGLAEAKTVSETPYGVVLRGVDGSSAQKAMELLRNAGAEVIIE
jgi:hypothetical protein